MCKHFWLLHSITPTVSATKFDTWKLTCPNLKYLHLWKLEGISALCCHQLPTAYFNKLQTLEVWFCGKLRNLMCPSVARGLLNLKKLYITSCESMKEMIIKGEGIITLFPWLEQLDLIRIPKLGLLHFHFSVKWRLLSALKWRRLSNM